MPTDVRFRSRAPLDMRYVAGLGLLLILGCAAYPRIGEWLDHRRYPQVGRSVNVGSRSLDIHCQGHGRPAVIFESGYARPGYDWVLVQPRVAEFTEACWYDRAGEGWSDLAAGRRWSDSVASDLHSLLDAAGVPGPYILVGHSLGAYHVRAFNARYPTAVAGLVLVDPSNEEVAQRIPDMPRSSPPNLPPLLVHSVDATFRQLGILRWMQRDPCCRPPAMPPHDWNVIRSLLRQRKSQYAATQEAPESGSAAIARVAGGLDSVPLIVLTRGTPFPFADTARGTRLLREWVALSADLARRSRNGSQVVVPNSGHFIQFDAPDSVVAAIRREVDAWHAARRERQ